MRLFAVTIVCVSMCTVGLVMAFCPKLYRKWIKSSWTGRHMPRMTERWLQQQRSSRILGILLTRCVDCELGGVRDRILSNLLTTVRRAAHPPTRPTSTSLSERSLGGAREGVKLLPYAFAGKNICLTKSARAPQAQDTVCRRDEYRRIVVRAASHHQFQSSIGDFECKQEI
jgi:hypothetical protein